MNLRLYIIACLSLGLVSALADAQLKTPNPLPYMTSGAGLLGGISYIFLLILGKWVD